MISEVLENKVPNSCCPNVFYTCIDIGQLKSIFDEFTRLLTSLYVRQQHDLDVYTNHEHAHIMNFKNFVALNTKIINENNIISKINKNLDVIKDDNVMFQVQLGIFVQVYMKMCSLQCNVFKESCENCNKKKNIVYNLILKIYDIIHVINVLQSFQKKINVYKKMIRLLASNLNRTNPYEFLFKVADIRKHNEKIFKKISKHLTDFKDAKIFNINDFYTHSPYEY